MCFNPPPPKKKKKEMVVWYLVCKDENHHSNMSKLAFEETIIERVLHSKVPGVTLSANLCWNMHLENTVHRASK